MVTRAWSGGRGQVVLGAGLGSDAGRDAHHSHRGRHHLAVAVVHAPRLAAARRRYACLCRIRVAVACLAD